MQEARYFDTVVKKGLCVKKIVGKDLQEMRD